ncbi:unnamed protein product [Leptidea sinapis]|uniref:Uncharacterized protein n=1 Tax=Leptidea sinapis TaxID=189913 RepID=A0A5E4QGU3_9NEOP|nr:unnamed protein product [Leptidea sinapis]
MNLWNQLIDSMNQLFSMMSCWTVPDLLSGPAILIRTYEGTYYRKEVGKEDIILLSVIEKLFFYKQGPRLWCVKGIGGPVLPSSAHPPKLKQKRSTEYYNLGCWQSFVVVRINDGPLLPLTQPRKRVAEALGIGKRAVTEILKEKYGPSG